MSPIIGHPTETAGLDLPEVGTKSMEPSLTRVRSVQEADVAVEALQHVARYDSMRLETYRQKENLADRICVSSIGSAVALRFDDVGYFNRVYCADRAFFEELPEIEAFYRGGPFGCELVASAFGRVRQRQHLASGLGTSPPLRMAVSPQLQFTLVGSGDSVRHPSSETFRATAVSARLSAGVRGPGRPHPGRPAEHATSI